MSVVIPRSYLDMVAVILESFEDPEACWIWPKSIYKQTGYGQAAWQIVGTGKSTGTTAHRVSWTVVNGSIPDDMTIDHLCRVRACINPSHLRLLSNLDNATDNGHASKTECPLGHLYDEENTYRDPEGHRRCRKCIALVQGIQYIPYSKSRSRRSVQKAFH